MSWLLTCSLSAWSDWSTARLMIAGAESQFSVLSVAASSSSKSRFGIKDASCPLRNGRAKLLLSRLRDTAWLGGSLALLRKQFFNRRPEGISISCSQGMGRSCAAMFLERQLQNTLNNHATPVETTVCRRATGFLNGFQQQLWLGVSLWEFC